MANEVKISGYSTGLFSHFGVKQTPDITQSLSCNTTTLLRMETGEDFSECGPWETGYRCADSDIPGFYDPILNHGVKIVSGDPEIQVNEDNTFAVRVQIECPSWLESLWPSVSSRVSRVSVDLVTSQGSFPLFRDRQYSIEDGQELSLSVSRGRFDMDSAYTTCIADDWSLSISWPDGYEMMGATIYNGSLPIMGGHVYDQCEEIEE